MSGLSQILAVMGYLDMATRLLTADAPIAAAVHREFHDSALRA